MHRGPNVIIKLARRPLPTMAEGTAAPKGCVHYRSLANLMADGESSVQKTFWTLELVGRIDEITEVRTCTQRRTGIHRRVLALDIV